MKRVPLWVRRVTMEIVIRAPGRIEAADLTESMVEAAIDAGRQSGIYGDTEAQVFIAFDGDVQPLTETPPLVTKCASSDVEDKSATKDMVARCIGAVRPVRTEHD